MLQLIAELVAQNILVGVVEVHDDMIMILMLFVEKMKIITETEIIDLCFTKSEMMTHRLI